MAKFWTKISFFKTIYFNLKAFPIKTALRIPVIIGKGVILKNIGKIDIENCDERTHIASMPLFNTCNHYPTIWDNRGVIKIKGRLVVQPGVCIHTLGGAEIEFAGNNYIGANTLIASHKRIYFALNSRVSWNCQLCDTDFHFIQNIETGRIKNNVKAISIGENVWIGNHVIIGKGVHIAPNCIVGQGSLVNKSFNTPNKIIVGNPPKEIEGSFQRIWDYRIENRLYSYFQEHGAGYLHISDDHDFLKG